MIHLNKAANWSKNQDHLFPWLRSQPMTMAFPIVFAVCIIFPLSGLMESMLQSSVIVQFYTLIIFVFSKVGGSVKS